MRNLLKLLYAYHFLILFILLEGLALFLIIENNHFQRSRMLEFSQGISGGLYKQVDNFKSYLALKETNQALASENIELRNKLASIRKIVKEKRDTLFDTVSRKTLAFFAAKVINNTVQKQFNYLTLNKGANDGIRKDMAVITAQGIVGVVIGVSDNFSTVQSVLNRDFKVSVKFKKNNQDGSLTWNCLSPSICILNDILFHVKVHIGDTLVTTGFSTETLTSAKHAPLVPSAFPEGITVGTVQEFDLKSGNSYTIKVKLANDFRQLNYVTVLEKLTKTEQQELEIKSEHD